MASKIVDKRNQSEQGEYAIGFASRKTAGSSDFEHAFVIFYYSDPQGMRTVRRGLGFYPTTSSVYDLLVGEVGAIIDDSKEQIDKELIVLVNSGVFNAAKAVRSNYESGRTYSLFANNCVTFVSEIASVVPALVVPNQWLNPYPSNFVAALYDSN
jgi:hypothetical protein